MATTAMCYRMKSKVSLVVVEWLWEISSRNMLFNLDMLERGLTVVTLAVSAASPTAIVVTISAMATAGKQTTTADISR